MNISVNQNAAEAAVALEGRLDSGTASELEEKLAGFDGGTRALHLDLAKLQYISSAGLRVLLALQKKMNAAGGKMTVHNPNEFVMEVFDATGFSDILTIQND